MRLILVALSLSLALGCSRGGGSNGPAAAPATADSEMAALLDTLGDRAPLVGVLDPRNWQTVHARLTPLAERLPAPAPAMFRGWATPEAAVGDLLRAALDLKTAPALSGLDLGRPIAFALFEASAHGPPGAAVASIDFNRPQPLRHEFVLPATDAAALETSLKALFDQNAKPVAHGWDVGILQVGIKRDGDRVRLAALMPATVDTVDQLWRDPGEPSQRTPAFVELASPGAIGGILLRPWRLRTAWGQHGANQMAFAMSAASSDMRMPMFAQGLSIVLGGAGLMRAERPEFEDAVIRLLADDAGIALVGTHSITPLLQEALAGGKPGVVFATKAPPLVESWQRVDWRGLLDGVGPRPAMAKVKRMRDFVRQWQECGLGCTSHTLTRVPFSSARGAIDLAPAEVKLALAHLPTAAQVAFLGMDGRVPTLAFAADVDKAFDTGLLRKSGAPVEVHLIPRGERAALLVGVGVDPRTVFDHTQAASAKGMGYTRVDLSRLASTLPDLPAPAKQILAGLGPITGDARHPGGGRALSWRLHLATVAKAQASAFTPRIGAAFTSPITGYAASPGDRCLAAAVDGAAKVFDALASVAPDHRGAILAKGFGEMDSELACAAEHPSTRPAADGLRRLFVQLAAVGAEGGQSATILPFIEAQCAATKDAAICAEAKRVAALPKLSVPKVRLHCAPAYGGGREVQITADGLFLDGAPTRLTALAALSEPVIIAADAALSFGQVQPVLAAVPKDTVQISVRDGDRTRHFLIGAPYEPPTAPPSADGVVLRVKKDMPFAEVVKQMDALRAKGVENIALEIEPDTAPAPPVPAIPAGDEDVEVIAPDRLKALLLDTAPDSKALPQTAAWRISVEPGLVKAFRPGGDMRFAEPIERGRALRTALGQAPAKITVDAKTPWAEAAQVLATVCERGELVAASAPVVKVPIEPKPVISPGVATVGKSLDKAAIQRVIRRHTRQARYCYEKALQVDPKLEGKVTLSFTIQTDGAVRDARVKASKLPQSVSACLIAQAERWRFPKAATITQVNYPFVFKVQ